MSLYRNQFSEEHDFPYVEKPTKYVVIASTARSGSHMLGHAMFKTGAFGFPLEYVNRGNLEEWMRRLGTGHVLDTIREIEHRRTSPNGVFSIKLHYSQIAAFGGFKGVMKVFPGARYVLIGRQNVLRQAISYAIASQTGVWISGQQGTRQEPRYDFGQVDWCLRELVRDQAAWRYMLAATGCPYLEVDFDQAKKDMAGTIRTIAAFSHVALEPQQIPAEPVTKKQSNALNDEWERRFLSDFNGETLFPDHAGGIKEKLKHRLTTLLEL